MRTSQPKRPGTLMRRPVVHALVLVALALLLLFAFHHTVARAVQRAEERRLADAQVAVAASRCLALQTLAEQRRCMRGLGLTMPAPSPGCEKLTPDGAGCVFGPSRPGS